MSTGLKSLVDRVRRCGERTPSTASSTLLRRRRKILREGCCREAAARSYVVSVAHATGVGSAVTFDTGFTASILTATALCWLGDKMPMIAGTRARSVFAASGTYPKPTFSRFKGEINRTFRRFQAHG